ncbi:MAG: hypothetical protein ABIT04_04275 [Novosphingobium sp.]
MMGKGTNSGAKSGMTAGMMLGGAVAVLALPSAVLAFTARFDAGTMPERVAKSIGPLEAGNPGSRLARGLPLPSLTRGQIYPFTPAKNPNRPDRSVTVAVRLDPQALKSTGAFGDRSAGAATAGDSTLGLAQSAFSLGVARGYRNFAQDGEPVPGSRKPDQPDLARYSIAPGGGGAEGRFSPRIVLEERSATGRAPRTFAGDKEDLVDLGGSYRVARNLAVTAGVRYSQDRERLVPLTDGKQDNQAVYVGTQFRF